MIECTDDVIVYAHGLIACSVCAPADMPIEIVEKRVNTVNPTGIDSAWSKSPDVAFANGAPNPVTCNGDDGRVHYLMEC